MLTDLENYRILKEIDSNNLVIIAKQDTLIANLSRAIDNRNSVISDKDMIIANKDILLNIEKARRRKQLWITGGSLGGAIVIGILSILLIR